MTWKSGFYGKECCIFTMDEENTLTTTWTMNEEKS